MKAASVSLTTRVVHQTQGVGGDIPCRGVIKDNAAMVGAGNADNILNNGAGISD